MSWDDGLRFSRQEASTLCLAAARREPLSARFPEPGRFWELHRGWPEPVAKATPAKMAAASSSDSDSYRAER